jgi:lysophospholipase L1-like esterase
MSRNMDVVSKALQDGIRKFSKKDPLKANTLPFARLIEITQRCSLDGTDLQVMIKFCCEAGIPVTFREFGFPNTEETQRYVAKRMVLGGFKQKGLDNSAEYLYIQLRKINCWGEKISGLRGPKQIAEELVMEEPELVAKIRTLNRLKLAFLGDSLMTTLHWAANAGYPDIISELCLKYNKKVSVANIGFGGFTAWQGVEKMKECVLPQKPDYCFVFFGGNDLLGTQGGKDMKPMARHRRSMGEIAARLKKAGTIPVFMTGALQPFWGKLQPLFEREVAGSIRALGKKHNVEVIETYERMKDGDIDDWIAPDGCHLNNAGQKKMATIVVDWLFSASGTRRPS